MRLPQVMSRQAAEFVIDQGHEPCLGVSIAIPYPTQQLGNFSRQQVNSVDSAG